MTRVVGNDNWMKSAVRRAAWHVDRLCLLREHAQRSGDRSERMVGGDPDDGGGKAVSGRCIGYPGTDKPLGRRRAT
jgi:hypothetical protein